ncbi:Zinc finger CCCH domain-containing protein 15 [Liparis tanakae]|uniref:Zinc finger CCCH domain-containing protein 15 n=1 Tax=Liparis tanakae TaxID=230148 RepID=A0A4Z2EX82_9TELE|nr:Zinc finger CCCH domain-containing protein 15 [Liparis tanakae]
MPPKKPVQPATGKKTQEKKKEKIIEDKTFGLKNKKGGKQQKFIKNVTNQVKPPGTRQEGEKTSKKTEKKKELDELNELFKPVVAAQKVAKGVDPKSVLCAFFKQGQCTKGEKCKFSHDLTMERKCEKRSLYVDERDGELEKDTMDTWDEKKLEEVINKKHGEAEKKKTQTQIVCKHFLYAIENNKYGWFWSCPVGGDVCMYRHALPPGFVLKKDKKKEEKEEDKISLEELIENERAALGANVTRITLDTFLAWKKRKRQEKIDKAQVEMEKKKADFKSGKSLVVSGREVFEFRPDLIDEDDDEAVDTQYMSGDDEEEDDEDKDDSPEVQDIDLSRFVPQEVDNTGITMATTDRFASRTKSRPAAADHEEQMNGACGGEDANGLSGEEEEEEDDEDEEEVPVDENLFTGEDLDELDEELNTLALED